MKFGQLTHHCENQMRTIYSNEEKKRLALLERASKDRKRGRKMGKDEGRERGRERSEEVGITTVRSGNAVDVHEERVCWGACAAWGEARLHRHSSHDDGWLDMRGVRTEQDVQDPGQGHGGACGGGLDWRPGRLALAGAQGWNGRVMVRDTGRQDRWWRGWTRGLGRTQTTQEAQRSAGVLPSAQWDGELGVSESKQGPART